VWLWEADSNTGQQNLIIRKDTPHKHLDFTREMVCGQMARTPMTDPKQLLDDCDEVIRTDILRRMETVPECTESELDGIKQAYRASHKDEGVCVVCQEASPDATLFLWVCVFLVRNRRLALPMQGGVRNMCILSTAHSLSRL
jgi:hypothetical protein